MSRFIAVDNQNCTGCKTCEMVCSLYHWGESNPWKSAIRVIRKEQDGLVFTLPLVCQQCEDPACLVACAPGAISRKEDGALAFNRQECTDCGLCVTACPASCVPVNADGKVFMYCDLCDGNPQCVPNCHWQCLTEIERSHAGPAQNVEQLASIIQREDLWDYLPGRRMQ
jgi:Fe-S-cluster-containing hydrogenase component 2